MLRSESLQFLPRSFLIRNSDEVHFLPLFRVSPPNSCRLRSDYNSCPHFRALLALSGRENSITCASPIPLGLLEQHMFIDGLRIHNSGLGSPFSNLFPASLHSRFKLGADGRRPEVQLQCRSSSAAVGMEGRQEASSLDLSSVLFSSRRRRRSGGGRTGQRPSLFFLPEQCAIADRQERRGEERRGDGSPKATACAPLPPLPRSRAPVNFAA